MPNQPPTSLHAAFELALNSADLEALTALYEPEAVLSQPTAPVSGWDAIRKAYRGVLALKPQIRVETLGMLDTAEGLALLHGRWTMTGTGPDGVEIRMEGRNTEVVRRQPDGSWRYLIDDPFAP
ncbi:MAG: DUF4440 domain-containing protein [Acidobacteriia bacterium]|nr:DUF4440 domain-containing protein [Terriglobia bacterium]